MALLTGLSAAADANTYSTTSYSGYVATPYGGAVYGGVAHDNRIGLLNAYADRDRGEAAIEAINARLDATVAEMSTNIIQTTTVDPRAFYAGRIVVDKGHGKSPQPVSIVVTAGGIQHVFAMLFDDSGKASAPHFDASAAVAPGQAVMAPASPVRASVGPTASAAPSSSPPLQTAYTPRAASAQPLHAAYAPPPASPRSDHQPPAATAKAAVYRDVPVAPSAL